ncbi:MAG: hypothetical protein MRT15_03960 [archaeon YNP-LCB-003-016]|uniref:hypothetical protein n=1 Tax=Candidatus Culexarchaeum yellowstonense TaxID=2928963 RepID=UPI0026F0ED83|nr:hypothetical protein [Candidatus Culexarchaeum yellowstonense]MCR6691523.1 hypothetical protein [Candidatus Culexarchaeum yellowstonense]
MTVIALTTDGRKIAQTIVSGPSSYATGGFTVRFGELNRIDAAIIRPRVNLKISNYVHVLDYTVSGNAITITVYRIDVTATTASWSEVPAGTDISALILEITVIGV